MITNHKLFCYIMFASFFFSVFFSFSFFPIFIPIVSVFFLFVAFFLFFFFAFFFCISLRCNLFLFWAPYYSIHFEKIKLIFFEKSLFSKKELNLGKQPHAHHNL